MPQQMNLPQQVKRSVGIAPNFLCDNAKYVIGLADPDKDKPERVKSCHEAFCTLHHQILDDIDHPAARAILRFLDSWISLKSNTIPGVSEAIIKDLYAGSLIVFMVGAEYAH